MTNKTNTIVIGSGVGGLAAGCWLKSMGVPFLVIDKAEHLPLNLHNGVHYLHSLPLLPFQTEIKEITLTDGILDDDGTIRSKATLTDALNYSEKVREIQHPSSIMNVGKETKAFMPKSNTLNTLLQEMYDYIGSENFVFGAEVKACDGKEIIIQRDGEATGCEYENIITTAPAKDNLKMFLDKEFDFKSTPINVLNYKVKGIVPNWMINLYVPSPNTPMYRASILNGVCSVELSREAKDAEMTMIPAWLGAFHIDKETPPDSYSWTSGKVTSISIDDRELIVDKLKEVNVYPIGRFALWNRKLLVDSTISQARAVVEVIANKGTWDRAKTRLIK